MIYSMSDFMSVASERPVATGCVTVAATALITYIANRAIKMQRSQVSRPLAEKVLYLFSDHPLHACARRGYAGAVRFLITKGSSIEAKNKKGETPWLVAAAHGQVAAMRVLAGRGADMNAQDVQGKGALHKAAKGGHVDVMNYLQSTVSRHIIRDRDGNTPFHLAAASSQQGALRWLVDRKAKTDIQNTVGDTALHEAAREGRLDDVKFLLELGASPYSLNLDHQLPISCAAYHKKHEILRLLLKSIKTIRGYQSTAIRYSARVGDLQGIQIVKEGLTPSEFKEYILEKNISGITSLHCAVDGGHEDVVKYLLDHGALEILPTEEGGKLFRSALRGSFNNIARILLVDGATSTLQQKDLRTLFDTDLPLWTLFKRAGGVGPPLYRTCLEDEPKLGCSKLEAVKFLLVQGARQQLRGPKTGILRGATTLHAAAFSGAHDVCKYLVQRGVDVNALDSENRTPLHIAAEKGHDLACLELLRMGANVNARDSNRRTPLHYAALNDHEEALRCILNCNPDAKVLDKGGLTPLHCAAQSRNSETLVRLLLDYDPQVNRQYYSGETPLCCAVKWGNERVVKLLMENGARLDGSPTPLCEAISKGSLELMQILVDAGSRPRGALRYALIYTRCWIREGGLTKSDKLDHLVKFFPNIVEEQGLAAIESAATMGDVNGVKWLIERGVKLSDIRTPRNKRPLIFTAVEKGDIEMVRLLARGGCSLNMKFRIGRELCTPLDLAHRKWTYSTGEKHQNYKEMMRVLRSMGAQPSNEQLRWAIGVILEKRQYR